DADPKFFACLVRFESSSVPTTLPTAYDVYPLDGRHDGGYYRSEERRVGKECRFWWAPYHSKKKREHCLVCGSEQKSSTTSVVAPGSPARSARRLAYRQQFGSRHAAR